MATLQTDTFKIDKLEPFRHPEDVRTDSGEFDASLVFVKGEMVGRITGSGKIAKYAAGAADGTETAIGMTVSAFTTDANGVVKYAAQEGEQSDFDVADYYIAGAFLVADLTGFDAAAGADLGRVENGVLMMEGK